MADEKKTLQGTDEQIGAICSQLLRPDDLKLESALLERLEAERIVARVEMEQERPVIRLFSLEMVLLSDVMPILHNFGFRVIDEVTYTVGNARLTVHVSRFNLEAADTEALMHSRTNVEAVIIHSLSSHTFENCRIYSLVYRQNVSLRQVILIRAMIEYINQLMPAVNFETILATVTRYDRLSRLLLHYFSAKFDPTPSTSHAERIAEIEPVLAEGIKAVPEITDDRILKLLYALLRAVVRTNFYMEREAIAFKIDVTQLAPNLDGVQPAIEIFVFHPEFRGTHQRMSTISRGGLRWSERHDDYRSEVRSLMQTQEGKNAIIIPDGGKGGFVIERSREGISREYFNAIYVQFITNLLDVVDNRTEQGVQRDERIVAYDGEDSYFVVAADKGTAMMSDVANGVAKERGFWLGDAFASGGSQGYSHKDLGITAKGAYKSTQRFFLERGIDPYTDPITVVGIGSMSGDVFGNGMLLSKALRLQGAISSREIFVDPDPIPQSAFEERQRLFTAKSGSWRDYNASLISEGGGVFLRSEKAIELTPAIRDMLKTHKRHMSGEELARALLCMPVDLLFNGGVGTYVKHSDESDLELGDKQNEGVRVKASQLRCLTVCEGGNLGFTPRGRIEYALRGGKLNLDGIDNAAGVHTSDFEVNLKILFSELVRKHLIGSEAERNAMLQKISDHVTNTVLWNNYRQALAISRDEIRSRRYLEEFLHAVDVITESVEAFNRRNFLIPKNENVHEILTPDGALVRPILGQLLSYAKIFIKKALVKSTLIDEPFAQQYLLKYFPKSFVSVYEDEILSHPLRRRIIATELADMLINNCGVTFIADYTQLGEEKFLMKIKSYLLSNQLLGANNIRFALYRQDYEMPITTQYHLLEQIEQVLEFSTDWMVRYMDAGQIDVMRLIDYKEPLFNLLESIESGRKRVWIEGDEGFNHFFGVLDYLRFAVAVIVTKEQTRHPFEDVATIFYLVVNHFEILAIINRLDALELQHDNDVELQRQMKQFVEYIAVHYTRKILEFQRTDEAPDAAFRSFLADDPATYSALDRTIKTFISEEQGDLKTLSVVVNALMGSIL